MAGANDSDDPWAIPEGHLKSRRNIVDRTKALSLNDKSKVSCGDINNERQLFGGFSVPKVCGENVFGGNLNLRSDSQDGRNNHERVVDGSYSSNSRGMPFNSFQTKNSFGSSLQRGFGSTFGGGLRSTKPTDPSSGDRTFTFRATTPGFDTGSSFSKRNLLVINSNQASSMGQFTAPASTINLSNSSVSSQFNSSNERWANRRNRPEGEGDSELERKNLDAENSYFSSAPPFAKSQSFNNNVANVRMQQPFKTENSPTTHTLSLEEREKKFWEQAACRSSPFVPSQMATDTLNNTTPKFGGFTSPSSGRPLYGRSLCADKQSEKSRDTAPSFSASHQRKAVMNVGQESSQHADDGLFPKDEYEKPMPNDEISLLNKILHKKLENLQNGSLEISQARSDPNSPLYSVTSFQNLRLKDELLKALDKMSFYMPSKIQEAALPLLLVEPPMNLIAQAQSGTGKTATFVLTMLSRVVPSNKWPQCLCLAPTYELAMQIGQVVKKMSEFLPEIEIRYAVKGEQMSRGEKIEEQIIIGTPGKMLDWVTKLKVIDPSKIICLVLDEADVMISQQGHQDQSIRLHNELERSGAKYQSLLFSATYDESVRSFADYIIKDAVNITLRRDEQTLKNIKQYYVKCANREEKYEAVMNLYGGLTIASAIIFCYTRKSAEWLAARMSQRGHDVTVLHGEMTIEDRARTIQQFKDSIYKVLITTNVCARGIDVSQVSVVINYDPPVTFADNPQPDYETYIHRIGRTGRFGKAGIAINLVSDDFSLSVIQRIGDYFGVAIESLDASDMDQLEAIDKDKF
ncbi:DEAD/DEAH box helicase family protein [Brugia malayi]|uniref:RNA helicase n=2 Tax=Brugia malayi TaxID=6279 RepID=A0A1P6C582_BRUMA|nr:DEAD/DEAH box helicase family protein [Brugia malayi]CDP99565.2 BMA-DDX-19, isoform a [Brugia malayi]VIO93371.1 DEAD/DEAH box helicase family protein [Brugia malayi]